MHWVKSTRNKGDILVEEKYISADLLVNMATKMFIAEGLRNEDAQTIAMDLVAADLRGLASHGVSRIPMYLSRIRLGLVTPRPDIKVTKVAPAAILIDGDNGMGFLASHKAVKVGVGLAEETGIAIVGVRRSTHLACLPAMYSRQLTQDMFLWYLQIHLLLCLLLEQELHFWSSPFCRWNPRRK